MSLPSPAIKTEANLGICLGADRWELITHYFVHSGGYLLITSHTSVVKLMEVVHETKIQTSNSIETIIREHSFVPFVRTCGLVAYWNCISNSAGQPFPFPFGLGELYLFAFGLGSS
jgi:hypothetical protein